MGMDSQAAAEAAGTATPAPCNVARLRADRAGDARPRRLRLLRRRRGDERTLRENVAAFAPLALRPRVLVDVSEATTATTVLGTEVSMPLLVAPVAFQRMAHPRRRGRHGPRGGGGRDGDGAVHARHLHAGRDRRGGSRRAALVPALLLPRPGSHPGADRPGRGGRLRGDRADRRRSRGSAAASATCAPASSIPADVTVPSFAAAAGEPTAGTPADMFALMDPAVTWRDLEELASGHRPAGAGEGHR